METTDLLSFRAYARYRGVSPEAVSKAVKSGRISTVSSADGTRLIDPSVADKEWLANTRPSVSEADMPCSSECVLCSDTFSINDLQIPSTPCLWDRSTQKLYISNMADGLMDFIELDGIHSYKPVIEEFMLKVFDEVWDFNVPMPMRAEFK